MNKVLFVAAVGLILTISACSSSHERLIRDYEKAHNNRDLKTVMSLYNPDITFELEDVWIKRGLREIGMLEQWDMALNSQLQFTAIRIEGDKIFCKVIEENDWFKAAGIPHVTHVSTIFKINNGRISNITTIVSKEDQQKIHNVINALYKWSKEENDKTLSKLIVNGEFRYSAETAKEWLNLFRNWTKPRGYHVD